MLTVPARWTFDGRNSHGLCLSGPALDFQDPEPDTDWAKFSAAADEQGLVGAAQLHQHANGSRAPGNVELIGKASQLTKPALAGPWLVPGASDEATIIRHRP
jgi:hypothetical protein